MRKETNTSSNSSIVRNAPTSSPSNRNGNNTNITSSSLGDNNTSGSFLRTTNVDDPNNRNSNPNNMNNSNNANRNMLDHRLTSPSPATGQLLPQKHQEQQHRQQQQQQQHQQQHQHQQQRYNPTSPPPPYHHMIPTTSSYHHPYQHPYNSSNNPLDYRHQHYPNVQQHYGDSGGGAAGMIPAPQSSSYYHHQHRSSPMMPQQQEHQQQQHHQRLIPSQPSVPPPRLPPRPSHPYYHHYNPIKQQQQESASTNATTITTTTTKDVDSKVNTSLSSSSSSSSSSTQHQQHNTDHHHSLVDATASSSFSPINTKGVTPVPYCVLLSSSSSTHSTTSSNHDVNHSYRNHNHNNNHVPWNDVLFKKGYNNNNNSIVSSSSARNSFMKTIVPIPSIPMTMATVGCTCKKSRCLKLYCQCFSSSMTCGTKCKCNDCYNTQSHADKIEFARQKVMKTQQQGSSSVLPLKHPHQQQQSPSYSIYNNHYYPNTSSSMMTTYNHDGMHYNNDKNNAANKPQLKQQRPPLSAPLGGGGGMRVKLSNISTPILLSSSSTSSSLENETLQQPLTPSSSLSTALLTPSTTTSSHYHHNYNTTLDHETSNTTNNKVNSQTSTSSYIPQEEEKYKYDDNKVLMTATSLLVEASMSSLSHDEIPSSPSIALMTQTTASSSIATLSSTKTAKLTMTPSKNQNDASSSSSSSSSTSQSMEETTKMNTYSSSSSSSSSSTKIPFNSNVSTSNCKIYQHFPSVPLSTPSYPFPLQQQQHQYHHVPLPPQFRHNYSSPWNNNTATTTNIQHHHYQNQYHPPSLNKNSRIYNSSGMAMTISRQGCKCRRSSCLKKYCECYQSNIKCGMHCKCADCKNTETPLLASKEEARSSVSLHHSSTIRQHVKPISSLSHHPVSSSTSPPSSSLTEHRHGHTIMSGTSHYLMIGTNHNPNLSVDTSSCIHSSNSRRSSNSSSSSSNEKYLSLAASTLSSGVESNRVEEEENLSSTAIAAAVVVSLSNAPTTSFSSNSSRVDTKHMNDTIKGKEETPIIQKDEVTVTGSNKASVTVSPSCRRRDIVTPQMFLPENNQENYNDIPEQPYNKTTMKFNVEDKNMWENDKTNTTGSCTINKENNKETDSDHMAMMAALAMTELLNGTYHRANCSSKQSDDQKDTIHNDPIPIQEVPTAIKEEIYELDQSEQLNKNPIEPDGEHDDNSDKESMNESTTRKITTPLSLEPSSNNYQTSMNLITPNEKSTIDDSNRNEWKYSPDHHHYNMKRMETSFSPTTSIPVLLFRSRDEKDNRAPLKKRKPRIDEEAQMKYDDAEVNPPKKIKSNICNDNEVCHPRQEKDNQNLSLDRSSNTSSCFSEESRDPSPVSAFRSPRPMDHYNQQQQHHPQQYAYHPIPPPPPPPPPTHIHSNPYSWSGPRSPNPMPPAVGYDKRNFMQKQMPVPVPPRQLYFPGIPPPGHRSPSSHCSSLYYRHQSPSPMHYNNHHQPYPIQPASSIYTTSNPSIGQSMMMHHDNRGNSMMSANNSSKLPSYLSDVGSTRSESTAEETSRINGSLSPSQHSSSILSSMKKKTEDDDDGSCDQTTYAELMRSNNNGLPRSLSFRKVCSRCGKMRGEHGELGFGNKCIFQECGKCGANYHCHELVKQPMGILCQLTVKDGAHPNAIVTYEKKIKNLATHADLQKRSKMLL